MRSDLPTGLDLQQTLGSAKVHIRNYEQALTAAAVGMRQDPNIAQQMELLAILTEAHHNLVQHVEAVRVTLGLPWAKVIDVDLG